MESFASTMSAGHKVRGSGAFNCVEYFFLGWIFEFSVFCSVIATLERHANVSESGLAVGLTHPSRCCSNEPCG